MKNHILRPFLALALLVSFTSSVRAAVFTNSPSVVSNTYTGFITLMVSNIPTGDTVVVQKYLDADANGVIDPGDILVQQFTLTDGADTSIGGVTNYNVPGDLNTATGAITSVLSFQNGDIAQNLVGNYLYKLSSPAGHFNPKTNSFVVTNFPFAQKFTGTVTNNSGATLSNATVLLFPPPRPGHQDLGNPLGGTVANSAGAYTMMMPAGTYTLVSFYTNYVTIIKKAPVITLGGGATITTNLTVTNATASISGTVVDAANNAIVLPGVFMPVESTNGLLSSAFSDTNGNFSVRVVAGEWYVGTDDSGLVVHGYVGLNQGIQANSGATGVKVAFSKANALFYGSVKDILGNPMPAIDVNSQDNSNLFQMDGFTDMNGNYSVGVLGLGSSDGWQLGFSSQLAPTNYIFSQPAFEQNGDTNLNPGQVVLVNFTGILATNLITGNIKDSNGTNLSGLGVFAYTNINGTTYQNSVDTDTNGNYVLNVANGVWNVDVNCNGGNDSLANLGSYACPGSQYTLINGNNAVDNFTVQICGGISISTPATLPTGEVNVSYTQPISASDCNGNYFWSQTGGSLPGNLNLNSSPGSPTDLLSGLPSSAGIFTFTLQVNDGSGDQTNRQFTVGISNAVQITTTLLPNSTNGLVYSQQLQATNGGRFGGVPYSWTVTAGSLPANLNLATNGLLSGTLATSGQFTFTAQAADRLGGTANQVLMLNIIATNSATPPPVGIASATGGQMLIYYPTSGSNFVLQTATNLSGPWVTASNGVPAAAYYFTNTAPVQFFRLH
jgi:hypothetical protein